MYPWFGYEANAAVVATILDTMLNYTVKLTRLTAAQSWSAMAAGEIDVILENWAHHEEKKIYIEERRIAVSAGLTGNKGTVGWFVPIWMVQEYPGILDWRNLNRYASLFARDASSTRGLLLESERSYATNDAALIRNLGLNYDIVYSGSERATVEAARTASHDHIPLLFYFWQPHFLFDEFRFGRVNLPEYGLGCDAVPTTITCDYPVENLDQIARRRFAESEGEAFRFIQRFFWTNSDQNEVARYIAVDGLSYRQAASDWMYGHPDVWRSWLED